MTEFQDSGGFPFSGGELPEHQRAEKKRQLKVFINQAVNSALNNHPAINEFHNVSSRLSLQLEIVKQELAKAKAANEMLRIKLHQLEVRNKELGNREQAMLEHIANVDESAGRMNKVGNVAFTMFEVFEDWIPILQVVGKYFSKVATQLENGRPHAHSKVDGADIDELISPEERRTRSRWRDLP